MTYKPKNYWQNRLKNNFKLRGVGHLSFDDFYNQWLYKAKIRTLEKALGTQGITIADKTVCDIGCGTGFFVEFYSRRGAKEIIGVDITHISIENLKKKYSQFNFFVLDISSPSGVSGINRKFDGFI